MTPYDIEPIDINDPATEAELISLYQRAFKTPQPLEKGYVISNTKTAAINPSVFLAAKENGKIIGVNGYISTDFIQDGEKFTAYQSCWTATDPEHQGRKVFINIMNEAKAYLTTLDAGFIFGLGNDNSHPILIHKLGFRERPGFMAKVANVPLTGSFWMTKNEPEVRPRQIMPDENQIIKMKTNFHHDKMKVYRIGENVMWGTRRITKKAGLSLPYFYVGGFEAESNAVFRKLIRMAHADLKVAYSQLVMSEGNRYIGLLKNLQPVKMNGFITFDLTREAGDHLNIMFGAIDVY